MSHDSASSVVSFREGRPQVELVRERPVRLGRRSARLGRYKWFALFVVLPTLLTSIYYGLIAANRYVSEAQIVVRKASDASKLGGFASFLKTAGISGGADDTSTVQAYILSRDALSGLEEKLPIKSYFGTRGADFAARWPSWIYGRSQEEFYKYYRMMVTAVPSHETGVLTISVQAFDPAHAKAIALALLDLSEETVNRINQRVRTDAIRTASDEVNRSEEALVASQVALTQFRNRELILDPERNAVLLTELIGKLNTELAGTLAQIEQLRQGAPNSPQLPSLSAHAASIRQQIAAQRDLVSAAGTGLADKVSQYERLNLQRQFTTRRLASAVASLTLAQAEARRQQLFLERIVEPNLSDKSTMPTRLVNSTTVLGWSLLLYLVFWLISSGLREHAAAHSE